MRKLVNAELGRMNAEEFKEAEKLPVILVLDNVRSLNNIGSVFRTADAFRFRAIYLCGFTATPPHREIHKTALGATETVDWKYFDTTLEALSELKSQGFLLVSVEQAEQSTLLSQIKWDKKRPVALVFGNEVEGVDQTVVNASDLVLEIPQLGTKHSLNISVSVGVVAWDYVDCFLSNS
jgi:23S rRNA (guanosine2251-2'-O)-methyltransferase